MGLAWNFIWNTRSHNCSLRNQSRWCVTLLYWYGCSIHREFELWKPKICKYCKRYQNSLVDKNRCISSSHLKTPFVSRCVYSRSFSSLFHSFRLPFVSAFRFVSLRFVSLFVSHHLCVCLVWNICSPCKYTKRHFVELLNEWMCFLQLLACFRLLAKTKCITFYYVVQNKRDWKGRPVKYTLNKFYHFKLYFVQIVCCSCLECKAKLTKLVRYIRNEKANTQNVARKKFIKGCEADWNENFFSFLFEILWL